MTRWFRCLLCALVAGVSLAAAACGRDPTGERRPALEFSVFPAEQWSGGVVQVRVRGFDGRDSVESVSAGDSAATWSWVDDSTLSIVLPAVPSSSIDVSVVARGAPHVAGSVRVYGFKSESGLGLSLAGVVQVREIGGNPVVVGGDSPTFVNHDPLAWVDLVTGATQVLPGLKMPGGPRYGPSVTDEPLEFVLADSTDSYYSVWRIGSTPVWVDSLPFLGTNAQYNHVVRLSDSMWLTVMPNGTTLTFPPGGAYRFFFTDQAYAVYVSPRRDRTTFETAGYDRVPVFDNFTGDTIFGLPFNLLEGAAFSADGVHLYAVGGNGFRSDTLVAMDATTGAIEGITVLPSSGLALALDEAHDRLFVLASSSVATELLVYRLSTLSLEARLATPSGCQHLEPLNTWCWLGVVAPDLARNRVFVVIPAADLAVRWEFDLLP